MKNVGLCFSLQSWREQ